MEAIHIARRSRSIAIESIIFGMGLSVAAMGFAAAGLLMPVAGALLQEVIDVIVILNALRALRDGQSGKPRPATTDFGGQFREAHRLLWPEVQRIRQIADRLDQIPAPVARREVEQIHRFLTEKLLPHNKVEEAEVYPVVAEVIGGDDPTAAMSRAHLEIAHMVRILGRHLAELRSHGPGTEDIRGLRRILYGLHAILRLHFTQEGEFYFPLIDGERAA